MPYLSVLIFIHLLKCLIVELDNKNSNAMNQEGTHKHHLNEEGVAVQVIMTFEFEFDFDFEFFRGQRSPKSPLG